MKGIVKMKICILKNMVGFGSSEKSFIGKYLVKRSIIDTTIATVNSFSGFLSS